MSVEAFRAQAPEREYRAVDACLLVANAQPWIDSKAFKSECDTLKPVLARLKEEDAARLPHARTFVHSLLTKLPVAMYPNTRKLLVTMLVLPASSVQSERDFSVQVW